METVYDYNITEEESFNLGLLDKDFYLRHCTEEDAFQDLARLFYLRHDLKKAKLYADKLPPLLRIDFWRTVTHP